MNAKTRPIGSEASELAALESALDRELVDWRVDRDAAARAAAAGRNWSDHVWRAAEASGPLALSAETIARGVAIARRPVFICGVHRSGTTLVRDLLDSHPALAVLPAEGAFQTRPWRAVARLDPAGAAAIVGREWLRRLANHSNQPPFWLLGRSTAEGSAYLDFGRALLAWAPVIRRELGPRSYSWPLAAVALAYAFCLGARTLPDTLRAWVEKTPTNERYIDRLRREFPAARFVHVIRNPFDVLASRKRMDLHTFGDFRGLRAALADLARSYRCALARHGATDGYRLVRYEELIGDVDLAIDRVADFLGIESLLALRRPSVAGARRSAATAPSRSTARAASSPLPATAPQRNSRAPNSTPSPVSSGRWPTGSATGSPR